MATNPSMRQSLPPLLSPAVMMFVLPSIETESATALSNVLPPSYSKSVMSVGSRSGLRPRVERVAAKALEATAAKKMALDVEGVLNDGLDR